MKKNTLLGFMPSSLALAILSVIQPAFAEDNVLPTITLTAANSQSDGDVPTTTQSLKSEQPLFKTAKSVSVVTKEQIEKKQAMNLTDAIQGVAGVISAPLGRRGADDFIIRGQLSSDAIYVDGLRQAQASDSPSNITGLERIEVVKGPDSMDFGQTAPGGIVNLVTKRPVQDDFNQLDLRYGSHNLRQIGVDTNHTLEGSDKAAWRLNANYSDQDDATDHVYFKNFYISPSYNFDLGDKTDLSVIASYNHKEYVRQQGLPVYGSILPNSNGQVSRHLFIGEPSVDPYLSDSMRIGYNLKHIFDDGWTFKQNFAVQNSRLDGQAVFISKSTANSSTITRQGRDQHYDDVNFSIDNNIAKTVELGNMQHHLMLGLDGMHDTRDIWNYNCTITALNIYTPRYTNQDWCATKTLRSDSVETTLKTMGVYFKDQVDVTDRLNINLGLRHDWASVDAKSNYNDNESSKSSQAFSGSIAGLYTYNDWVSPYVSYSTSFLPVTDVDVDGNVFDPEKAKQYEVGLKFQALDQRLQASLAWFDLTRFNVVSSDANGDKYQTGEENTQGIETELAVRILPNWVVSANYSYLPTARIVDNEISGYEGKRLNNVSEQMFNLNTRYEFNQGALQGWFIGAGVRSESKKSSYKYDYTLPGYALFDAEMGYDAGSWQASVNAKNIFDKEYYAGGLSNNVVTVGDERQVNFNVRYKF
ncbi:TonB-dependent siderophore receptor [Acinetobacter sp. PK01]|uniref:TonB-dependent siderophore receptor n=1 Tax=Acinetobacter sp. PK01 TaxID=2930198 RepID=UPI001FB8570A|nr:TonB-dependent siderophore receptor [Acinetobacter sp. PK01]UOG18102.1 TonB-dependent siderophore receptor [Acinetobacter sp. PK01]